MVCGSFECWTHDQTDRGRLRGGAAWFAAAWFGEELRCRCIRTLSAFAQRLGVIMLRPHSVPSMLNAYRADLPPSSACGRARCSGLPATSASESPRTQSMSFSGCPIWKLTNPCSRARRRANTVLPDPVAPTKPNTFCCIRMLVTQFADVGVTAASLAVANRGQAQPSSSTLITKWAS